MLFIHEYVVSPIQYWLHQKEKGLNLEPGLSLLWLIRFVLIQGTVAPGWVQEWVQCTR